MLPNILHGTFYTESKQWSLKDLKCSSSFQELENDLKKKQRQTALTASDLDKVLDFVANVELKSSRPEEEVKSVVPPPAGFIKLKPIVKADLSKPVPKVQPINPQIKFQPPAPIIRKPEEPVQSSNNNNNCFRSARDQLVRFALYILYG